MGREHKPLSQGRPVKRLREITDGLPPWLYGQLRQLYFRTAPYVGGRLPVCRMEGQLLGRQERVRVLTAASSGWLNEFVAARWLGGQAEVEHLDTVPVWRLAQVLAPLRQEADLTVCLLDKRNAGRLFSGDSLLVPPWVGLEQKRLADLGKIISSSGSVSDDMRLIKRHGYRPVFCPGTEGVEDFLRDYAIPTVRNRHGEQGYTQTVARLKSLMGGGGLLWLEEGKERVSALACGVQNGRMKVWTLGVRNGEARLLRQGAVAGLYYFGLLHARAMGCSVADLRAARPFLTDGLLRYKRKWGCSMYEDTEFSHEDLAIYWPRWSPAVAAMVGETGTIFRHGGGLHALASDSGLDPAVIRKKYFLDGLSSLVVAGPGKASSAGSLPSDTRRAAESQLSTPARLLRFLES